MSSPFVTNLLLTIVAVLLLVQVIQTGMNESSSYRSSYSTAPSSYNSRDPHAGMPRNPTVRNDAPAMAHAMFGQALRGFVEGCDGEKTLSECDSPAAQVVKNQIGEWASSGLGPRQVFDKIVETYGEEALTPQAKQIRQARIQSQ